jgi:hypothetical protein
MGLLIKNMMEISHLGTVKITIFDTYDKHTKLIVSFYCKVVYEFSFSWIANETGKCSLVIVCFSEMQLFKEPVIA